MVEFQYNLFETSILMWGKLVSRMMLNLGSSFQDNAIESTTSGNDVIVVLS